MNGVISKCATYSNSHCAPAAPRRWRDADLDSRRCKGDPRGRPACTPAAHDL